ncbi:MAG: N-acetylmuramoyl-L-alanine amidase [Polyangiaceae bacterium]|nr:N-acetylmuramoyl-L-alanine amidase [Polyangiaceae bacterium]
MKSETRLSHLLTAFILPCVAACQATSPPANEDGAHDDGVIEASFGPGDLDKDCEEDAGYCVLPAVNAPPDATRVALMFDLTGGDSTTLPMVDARAIDDAGGASAWVETMSLFAEEGLFVLAADLNTKAAQVQVRVPAELAPFIENLTVSAVRVEDKTTVSEPKVVGGLPDYLVGVVRSRAQWGAKPTKCTDLDEKKTRLAVHHTVTPRSASGGYDARIRQIQAFHMDGNGWCDVGYHFLVTEDGTVYEARPMRFLGAHVYQNNTGNVGMSFVGCFHTSGCAGLGSTTPPQAAIEAASKVLGLVAKNQNVTISTSTLKGHRDHSGQSTTCPGDNLHSKLPTIRDLASAAASGKAQCKSKFTDICGSPHEDDIVWFTSEGFSSGCAADKFCPDQVVSREQMAAFLTKALNLPSGPDVFTDDETSPFEAAINSIAAAGVTSGCDSAKKLFCPKGEVTRGQMAAFLAKGFNLPTGPNAFSDDDGSPFEPSINAIAAAGITSGCSASGLEFCPDKFVTRAQMATFLRRALSP